MKLRSALLVACLVVVPLLAMVSHKIPAATRAALRKTLLGPITGLIVPPTVPAMPPTTGALPEGESPASGLPTDRASVDDAPDPIGEGLSAAGATAPSDPGRRVTPAPSIDPPVRLGEPTPALPPAPAILVGTESSLPIGEAGGRESLEARLRALGATRIDWTPAQGGDGLHRCSCRIPAEPTGQLHRVFQAAAPDPVAALDNLVGQVTAWSMRAGNTTGGAVAAGSPVPLR